MGKYWRLESQSYWSKCQGSSSVVNCLKELGKCLPYQSEGRRQIEDKKSIIFVSNFLKSGSDYFCWVQKTVESTVQSKPVSTGKRLWHVAVWEWLFHFMFSSYFCFLFVDGAVINAIYYFKQNFLYGSSVRVIISLDLVDIFICRWCCKQCNLLCNLFLQSILKCHIY